MLSHTLGKVLKEENISERRKRKRDDECDSILVNISFYKKTETYVVNLSVVGASFKVFALNQCFDTFFHNSRVWVEEVQLCKDFRKELLMLKCLPGLHDSNNSSFDCDRSVFLDSLSIHG